MQFLETPHGDVLVRGCVPGLLDVRHELPDEGDRHLDPYWLSSLQPLMVPDLGEGGSRLIAPVEYHTPLVIPAPRVDRPDEPEALTDLGDQNLSLDAGDGLTDRPGRF